MFVMNDGSEGFCMGDFITFVDDIFNETHLGIVTHESSLPMVDSLTTFVCLCCEGVGQDYTFPTSMLTLVDPNFNY